MEPQISPLLNLPCELWVAIIDRFDLPTLGILSRTTKRFRELVDRPALWKKLYQANYDLNLALPSGATPPWKAWYKNFHILLKRREFGLSYDKDANLELANVPQELRGYFQDPDDRSGKALDKHTESGLYYYVALLQAASDIATSFECATDLMRHKIVTYEHGFNNLVVHAILTKRVTIVIAKVVHAWNAIAQSKMLFFQKSIVISARLADKYGRPKDMAQLIEHCCQRVFCLSKCTFPEIWRHVEAGYISHMTPPQFRELEIPLHGGSKTPLLSLRFRPTVSYRKCAPTFKGFARVCVTANFTILQKNRPGITCAVNLEGKDVLKCKVANRIEAEDKKCVEQLVFELALCHGVQKLSLEEPDRSLEYQRKETKKVVTFVSVRPLRELAQERFPNALFTSTPKGLVGTNAILIP